MLANGKRIARHLAGGAYVLALGLVAGAAFPRAAAPQTCNLEVCSTGGGDSTYSCLWTTNNWDCALGSGSFTCQTLACDGGGQKCGPDSLPCQQGPAR